jgi:hypothetical protein
MQDLNITYRRTFQGAWELSAFISDSSGEYLLSRQFMGYTKSEAKELFIEQAQREMSF